jgi:hypothetical protein
VHTLSSGINDIRRFDVQLVWGTQQFNDQSLSYSRAEIILLHALLQREQEAERLRQEEQHLRKDAQEREQEAQRREQEAERLREEDRHRYERRIGKTTLHEFLDACHTNLYLGLTIQPDSTQSTQGDAANAENKPRPDRILPWPEFEAEQAHTWGILMESSFVRERHFTSQRTSLSMGDP